MRDQRTPFLGAQVDEVIGYAAHEGGHCLWSEPGKDQTIRQEISRRWSSLPQALKRPWTEGERNPLPDGRGGSVNPVLGELCRIQNILEDAHVDTHVGEKWPVLGEYIRIARHRLQERRPIDLDAIARQARPDRNAVLNLWIAISLYEGELPRRMSKRVRDAMTFLIDLTQKAIKEENGVERHRMAVDAGAYLFRAFPIQEAPLPGLPQAGSGGEGGDSTSGIPMPGTKGGVGEKAEDDGESTLGDGGVGIQASDEEEEEDDEAGEKSQDDGTEGEEERPQPAEDGDEEDADGEDSEDVDEGESDQEGQDEQGGDGEGQVGNLDDFDDRDVVSVPKRLLEEVAEAIAHEIEDLSQSVAEALAEDPRNVAASARKADDDPDLARRVTSQVMPQVQEIRRVFDRQRDIQARYLKGLPRGKLDGRRLARVGAGNLNAFQRKQVLERPDLAVGLLLDVSGSMNSFMGIVEQTAAVFAEGLIRKPGVNFAAWTYTGAYTHVALTRICDRRLGKLCLGNVEHGGGTPSGAAIAGVKVLMGRMSERKKVRYWLFAAVPPAQWAWLPGMSRCPRIGRSPAHPVPPERSDGPRTSPPPICSPAGPAVPPTPRGSGCRIVGPPVGPPIAPVAQRSSGAWCGSVQSPARTHPGRPSHGPPSGRLAPRPPAPLGLVGSGRPVPAGSPRLSPGCSLPGAFPTT